MKPEQFIRDYNLENAIRYLKSVGVAEVKDLVAIGVSAIGCVFEGDDVMNGKTYIDVSLLCTLIQSLELVEDAGGLERAKKKLEMSIFNEFLMVAMEKCQNPYMVHIERMQKAIRDHESIYGEK